MNKPATNLPKGNLLIVDDILPNLRLLAKILTKQGYKVRSVTNGARALRAAHLDPPDLILLDIVMPKMDGYEVCTQLKRDERTSAIPIIFISALDEVLDKVKAFSVGGVDYVTKPFQAAEVLARIETHLALRNLRRKLEQTNAALLETNTALQASNREIDAFAHTVAHNLTEPLGTIVGYADLLVEDLTEAELDKTACLESSKIIQRAGQTTTRIVDELLLLARVRKGEVKVSSVDMEKVIANVQERLAYILMDYQAEVVLPLEWPRALGYEPWLEEVWVNYISNGLKYGGCPPKLELGATPQADGLIRFWVHDNGPGLSPEAQAILFTEFIRLDEIQVKGHGLGLSIVRRIIEKLGGKVGVESETRTGSMFYFVLPGANQ